MSNSDLQAVRQHPMSATNANATTRRKNRVKGLSSWRGAKIGAVAFPVWGGLALGLEILIDWPVLVDSGDWILLAFALSLYGTVFGFILGLLSGAIVGMTYELFGPKATLATGFIIPLAIAAAILELRFSFDLWDSPGQHPLEFGVLVLATMLALIIIVRQHVRVLQNYAVSAAKIRHTPQLSSHL